MNYWLMKSEPEVYSIQDLKRDQKTFWDGVRNFQARNFLRDEIKLGDQVFYYHSNAEPSGIAGIAKVVKEGYPDATQFDPRDDHFDEKATLAKPIWFGVDIQYVREFKPLLALDDLRKVPQLKSMLLLRRGQRLSVQPVTAQEWKAICNMADR